jgi:hypothetical protein
MEQNPAARLVAVITTIQTPTPAVIATREAGQPKIAATILWQMARYGVVACLGTHETLRQRAAVVRELVSARAC